jgi:hypothetical protein
MGSFGSKPKTGGMDYSVLKMGIRNSSLGEISIA